MYLLIEDDDLLKKYDIWNKVSNSINKEFDSETIDSNKFLKTKIKSYSHKATDFPDKENPEVKTYFFISSIN